MTQIDALNITWDLGRDITYEVLIENLGGYESAKSKFRDNGSLHAERLRKALLEYRRQHNIFEVGDKVVFTDILNSCVVTFESTETDPMQIVWLTYPDGTAGYVFHLNKIKHATDEEIKAGKRLGVKSEN